MAALRPGKVQLQAVDYQMLIKQDEVAKLNRRIEELESRRQAAHEFCREAEERAINASAELTSLHTDALQVEYSTKLLEEQKAKNGKLRAELSDLTEQFCLAEADLQAARAQAKDAALRAERKIRAEVDNDLTVLKAKTRELEEERDRARQEGTRFLVSLSEVQRSHEEELKGREQLESTLRTELAVSRNHTKIKVAQLEARLNQTVHDLQQATERLRCSEEAASASAAEQSEMRKMYKRELEDAKAEIEELVWKLEATDRGWREETRRKEKMEASLRSELNLTKETALTTASELEGMLERARSHSRRVAARLDEERRTYDAEIGRRAKVEELLREEVQEKDELIERRRRESKSRIAIAVADASRFHARMSELAKLHKAEMGKQKEKEEAQRIKLQRLRALVGDGSGAVDASEVKKQLDRTTEELVRTAEMEVQCRTELEQVRTELAETLAEKSRVEAELQEELTELTAQLADSQMRSAQMLQMKEAMLQDATARLEDVSWLLVQAEKNLSTHVQDLEGKLAERAQKEAALQREISDVRAEVRALMAELQTALREREEARARDSIKVKQLRKKLRILEKKENATVEDIVELRSKAEEEQAGRRTQERELLARETKLQHKVQKLTEELELTRTEADEVKQEAMRTEDYLREKLDQRMDEIGAVREEALHKDEEATSLQLRIQALESVMEHNQTEASALRVQLEAKEEEVSALRVRMESAQLRLARDREARGERAVGLKQELKDMRGQLISAAGMAERELHAINVAHESPPITPRESPAPSAAPSREGSPTPGLRQNGTVVREASPIRRGAEDAQAKIIQQAKSLAGIFGKKLRDMEKQCKESKAVILELRGREKVLRQAAANNASQVQELRGHLLKLNETAEALVLRETSLQKLVTKLRAKLNSTEELLRVETAATEVLLANVSRLGGLLARERELQDRLQVDDGDSAAPAREAPEPTEKVRDLEAAISRLQLRVASDEDASSRARQLVAQIQGLRSSMAKVEAVAVQEHEELETSKRLLSEVQQNSSQAALLLRQANAERDSLRKQEASLRSLVDELKRELVSVQQERKRETVDREAAVAEGQARVEEAETALAESQRRVTGYQQQITDMNAVVDEGEEAKAERAKLLETEQRLQAELLSLRENLSAEQQQRVAEQEAAQKTIRELEQNALAQRDELEDTQGELNATRSNATLFREQLDLARQAMAEYAEEQDAKEHNLALELESVRMQLDAHWEDENLKSKQLETLAGSLEETLAGANRALRESEGAREELVQRQRRLEKEGARNASALQGLQRREQELHALLRHAESELMAVLRWLQSDVGDRILTEREGRVDWRLGVQLIDGQESMLGQLLASVEEAALAKVSTGHARVEAARQKMEGLEREVGGHRQQMEQLQAAMATVQQDSKATQDDLQRRLGELQGALGQADEVLRVERARMAQMEMEAQRTNAEFEEKLRSSEQAARDAAGRLAKAEWEANERRSELEQVRSELRRVEAELQQARLGLGTSEEMVRREQDLQSQLTKVSESVAWHRERMASMEREHQATLSQLQREVEVSRYTLTDAQTKVEQAQKNATSLTSELVWVRGALTEERARKLKSEEELIAKQRDLEDQLDGVRMALSRGQGLDAAMKEEAQRTAHAYRAELDQVREKLRADRERMEQIEGLLVAEQRGLENRLATAEAELHAERQRVAAAREEMNSATGRLHGDLEQARAEVHELQLRLDARDGTTSGVREELEEVKQTLESERKAHRTNVEDLLRRQRQLEDELRVTQMDVERRQEQERAMQDETRRQADTYQAELARLQDQLKGDRDKMLATEQELLSRTEQLEKDLATTLAQLQTETAHLQETQAAKEAETARLRSDIDTSQRELTDAKTQLQQAQQRASMQQQELDSMKATLASERARIEEAERGLAAREAEIERELAEVRRQMQNATALQAKAQLVEGRLRDKVKREREELGKQEEALLVRERHLKEQLKAAIKKVENEQKRRQSAEREAVERRQALQTGLNTVQEQAARAEQRLVESEKREQEQFMALEVLRERVKVAESIKAEAAYGEGELEDRLRVAEEEWESARAKQIEADLRSQELERQLASSESRVEEARVQLEELERVAGEYRDELMAVREELKREETDHVHELQELRSGLLSVQQQLMLRNTADSAPADQQTEARIRALEATLENANSALRASEGQREELTRRHARLEEEGARNASTVQGLKRREQELQALLRHAESELRLLLSSVESGRVGDVVKLPRKGGGGSKVEELLESVEEAVTRKVKEKEEAVQAGRQRVEAAEQESAAVRRELAAVREERAREEAEMLSELRNLASPETVHAPSIPPLPHSSDSSRSPSPMRMRDGEKERTFPRSPQVVKLRQAAEERERVMVSRQQDLQAELDQVRRELEGERVRAREKEEEGERLKAALEARLLASQDEVRDAAEELERTQSEASAREVAWDQLQRDARAHAGPDGDGVIDENERVALVRQLLQREEELAGEIQELKAAREAADTRAIAAVEELELLKAEMESALGDLEHIRAD